MSVMSHKEWRKAVKLSNEWGPLNLLGLDRILVNEHLDFRRACNVRLRFHCYHC